MAEPRRDFDLREADQAGLDGLGLNWDAVRVEATLWIIIHSFPLPDGYTIDKADVALELPANYPTSAIDMVYFHPPVLRRDGKAIPNADSTKTIEGTTFQRWSRHYTEANPWSPDEDDILSHLDRVKLWLQCELRR